MYFDTTGIPVACALFNVTASQLAQTTKIRMQLALWKVARDNASSSVKHIHYAIYQLKNKSSVKTVYVFLNRVQQMTSQTT